MRGAITVRVHPATEKRVWDKVKGITRYIAEYHGSCSSVEPLDSLSLQDTTDAVQRSSVYCALCTLILETHRLKRDTAIASKCEIF